MKDFTKPQGNLTTLQDCINECLLMHHTDMFFSMVYRQIIYLEYEKKGIVFKADLHEVYNKYIKVCSYILLESCKVQTTESSNFSQNEIRFYNSLYQPFVQHASIYRTVISTYVILREEVAEIIKCELFDQDPFYPKFYQQCMMAGYSIARKRIEDNLRNNNFFNIEFKNTIDSKVMILYPTPNGFLYKEQLIDILTSDKQKLFSIIDKVLENFEVVRITDDELVKKLSTRFVFKNRHNELFYFKRRTINEECAPFGEQDRNDTYRALLVQGQLNLTRYFM